MDGRSSNIRTTLEHLFPVWDKLTPLQRDGLTNNTVERSFPSGTHIHSGGSDCIGVLLIKRGTLRAYLLSDEGREITLFRMGDGESCVLSATCILPLITFDVFVDAQTDADLFIIAPSFYKGLIDENPSVEAFTYRQTAERFSEVMWVMQQVMFMSFDRRLAIFLVDETAQSGSDVITLTHDQIARHLGSAREVVSRMLKYFEHEGLVSLSRGTITVVDKPQLRTLAG